MLVLSRKSGQKVVLGAITLTVLEVVGGRVRLGIEAPADVHVLRDELTCRMETEGKPTDKDQTGNPDTEIPPGK
jgi:carbon storage regulator